MRPPRPETPDGLKTPGLAWRPRRDGWVAYWQARTDKIEAGFRTKNVRIWPTHDNGGAPTREDWLSIASRCEILQGEMLAWGRPVQVLDPVTLYDGTLGSLINVYTSDNDSPYKELRYHSRVPYDGRLEILRATVGSARMHALSFRDMKRWYEAFRRPATEGGADRIARGHALMTTVRIVIAYGAMLEIPDCKRMSDILSKMEFQNPQKRTEFLTAAQAIAIRAEAHRQGLHSIAIAQAFQYELMIRQKDAIGEWIPRSEPGTAAVFDGKDKWLHGIDWSNVSNDLILTKRISKSLRGRRATVIKESGKTESFDLTAYPMIMEELALIPGDRRQGPIVICESTGLPWRMKTFRTKWREIATAAGIPKTVQNRDSRAGGVTEAMDSGAPPDQVRRHAAHSQLSTTLGYSRTAVSSKNAVAEFRVKTRRTE